jgi:NADH-quinone oxidoreductase subunit G
MKRVGSDDGTGGIETVARHEGIVVVLSDALADQEASFGDRAALYVYLGHRESAATRHADFVLPVTTFAEQEGTFTNHEGRVQRFWPALTGPGMARPAWLIAGALVAEVTKETGPRSAAEAFSQLASAVPAFAGLTYDGIGARGAVLSQPVSLAGS